MSIAGLLRSYVCVTGSHRFIDKIIVYLRIYITGYISTHVFACSLLEYFITAKNWYVRSYKSNITLSIWNLLPFLAAVAR